MLYLKCTKSVQTLIGLNQNQIHEAKATDSLLGNWYVNVFTVDRRKTFIFMNERTLLSFILYGIKKSNIPRVHEMFINGVAQLLTHEGISTEVVNMVIRDYSTVAFSKTDSRSSLGNMNDLVFLYTSFILSDGGFAYCDIGDAISRINRTPQKNLDWSTSIETTLDILSAHVA